MKLYRLSKIICLLVCFFLPSVSIAQGVRPAARSGQFYPSNKIELKELLDEYLTEAKPVDIQGDIYGVWVPHAGYMFSGQIAANAYQALRGRQYDVIIIIGPSHHVGLLGASVALYDAFETPLGKVSVDLDLAKKLVQSSSAINDNREAHEYEHAIEVQLPFIQTVLPNTPIVPMVIGRVSLNTCKSIANTIHKATKDKHVLIIASSDMSHYPTYKDAYEVDLTMMDAIMNFDVDKVANVEKYLMRKGIQGLECLLCGAEALYTTMYVSEKKGCKQVQLLPYANSGDVSGERYRVVGYGAALFYKENGKKQKLGGQGVDVLNLSANETKQLFQIARESILNALEKKPQKTYQVEGGNLTKKRGVFVTLANHDQLRGCIGHFGQDTPLYQLVQEMAVAAAVQDYRFVYHPVTVAEMEHIDIKISILSSLKPIKSIDEIQIGKHGIWIKKGHHSGTYLPEVATEQGWNVQQFLEHCAVEKAGLDENTWQKDAEIYIYSSTILSEKQK